MNSGKERVVGMVKLWEQIKLRWFLKDQDWEQARSQGYRQVRNQVNSQVNGPTDDQVFKKVNWPQFHQVNRQVKEAIWDKLYEE